MTPRTQTGNVLCNIPAAVKLMSLKNAPYDIIVDEVDGADYRYEAARLKSFNNWPVKYIKAEKLATAGYFYTGELDIVKCFSCGTETYKWMEGDDPMVDHKRQSPMCKFVRNIPCGNVPTDVVSDVSIAPPESRDVCGPYDLPPDCRRSYSTDSSAKYPEYNFYEARLRTFECWPTFFKQNPEQLALAGFYYTGIGDQVLCFCCGVGVKDWEPDDDPWEQHAIWYPNCNHLHKVKGTKYVREITGRSVSSGDLQQTAPCVSKVEGSKTENVSEKDPGPSSQGSDDSGVESMSSNNSSVKDSTENLSDSEYSKPISDTRLCKICFDAEVSQMFLPCGHVVACADCAKCIKVCPMCREVITKQMRIFFS